eukprot:Pgem_evm1s8006
MDKDVVSYCTRKGIELHPVTVDHHESNGLAERTVRKIKDALRKKCIETGLEWDAVVDDYIQSKQQKIDRDMSVRFNDKVVDSDIITVGDSVRYFDSSSKSWKGPDK